MGPARRLGGPSTERPLVARPERVRIRRRFTGPASSASIDRCRSIGYDVGMTTLAAGPAQLAPTAVEDGACCGPAVDVTAALRPEEAAGHKDAAVRQRRLLPRLT